MNIELSREQEKMEIFAPSFTPAMSIKEKER